jgi:hypothetical protein
MIVELEKDNRLNHLSDRNSKGSTNQSMLLPEPATKIDIIRWRQAAEWDRYTRFP